ncbi:MAG: hypothetical protein JNM74_22210 [Myxococcales bacterium]|nr:hypothetical protein [Myxococcales bacterium]
MALALACLSACGGRAAKAPVVVVPAKSPVGVAPLDVVPSRIAPAASSSTAESGPCPLVGGRTEARDVGDIDVCACQGLTIHGTMKRCRAELHEYEELGGPHDTLLTEVTGTLRNDLDEDGADELVVGLRERHIDTRGEEHVRGRVVVFSVREGRVVRLASLETGPVTALVVGAGRSFIATEATSEKTTCDVKYALGPGDLRGERALVEMARRCPK